jgi:tetratricopeptide (TPR) repeat protein
MKMKYFLLGLVSLFALPALAVKGVDDGSKFGTGEDSIRCLENLSLYQTYYKIRDYESAYNSWKIVFDECPKAGGRTLYGNGAFLIVQKMMKAPDAEKQQWFDLLMKCYEQRIQYFGEDRKYSEAWIRGRQAVDYINYSADVAMMDKVLPWLKQAVDHGMHNADADVINSYFQMLEKQYQTDKDAFRANFIDEYLRIGDLLDKRVALADKQMENYKLVRSNIDNIFSASGAADCQTLEGVFASKVEAEKQNAEALNKIIKIFRMAGCKESDVYFAASLYSHKLNPTAETAAGCAYQAIKQNNLSSAVTFFDEALSMEQDVAAKYDYSYAKAVVLQKLNRYAEARKAAYDAISFDGTQGEPYILIATLYADSNPFGDDKILAKTVFWAAVDKLEKAKSVDPDCAATAQPLINSYRHHYPSKEDVFFKPELKLGSMFHIGGWINEDVRCRE